MKPNTTTRNTIFLLMNTKIKTMNNYKITNLTSRAKHYLNEEEKDNFFTKNRIYQNNKYQYSITNLTKQKRTRINKILTNIQLFCFFVLTICTTILIIEKYY